ncbi:hypothetical protein DFA_07396 [Cavenderia fasciculata]|uniref:Uncharacterized protein n=1 Tax=Cavenderia fasciculata TaxID=261658 RepID=F4PWA9_CACFS|nr:uncharacterized protein DFA_07396 [Cavenderia fasciculata]EGG20273.1 hypothetical protein DFA_07396 [Cavenderia fasciculata]|eukprot:XP_004367256.1 hypothetical protein DFA_07396 [Cavenderia fasciculata]
MSPIPLNSSDVLFHCPSPNHSPTTNNINLDQEVSVQLNSSISSGTNSLTCLDHVKNQSILLHSHQSNNNNNIKFKNTNNNNNNNNNYANTNNTPSSFSCFNHVESFISTNNQTKNINNNNNNNYSSSTDRQPFHCSPTNNGNNITIFVNHFNPQPLNNTNNNNNILYVTIHSFFTSSMHIQPPHCSPTNNNIPITTKNNHNNITIFTNHPQSFTNQSFNHHQSASQSPVPNPVIKSTSFQATITIRRPT